MWLLRVTLEDWVSWFWVRLTARVFAQLGSFLPNVQLVPGAVGCAACGRENK